MPQHCRRDCEVVQQVPIAVLALAHNAVSLARSGPPCHCTMSGSKCLHWRLTCMRAQPLLASENLDLLKSISNAETFAVRKCPDWPKYKSKFMYIYEGALCALARTL